MVIWNLIIALAVMAGVYFLTKKLGQKRTSQILGALVHLLKAAQEFTPDDVDAILEKVIVRLTKAEQEALRDALLCIAAEKQKAKMRSRS